MGVTQTIRKVADSASNPVPEARLDDILRPEGDKAALKQRVVTLRAQDVVKPRFRHRVAG